MRYKTNSRKAFTLIELLISISILSIMMVFLYKSYATLNKSNLIYKKEVQKLESLKLKKKTLFLDFSIAKYHSVKIQNQERQIDIVFMQSSHSVHHNYNPYVTYIISNAKLYRLESLKPLTYPLDVSSEFNVDLFGEVTRFRVFESKDKASYMIDVLFKNKEKILLKVKVLNEK